MTNEASLEANALEMSDEEFLSLDFDQIMALKEEEEEDQQDAMDEDSQEASEASDSGGGDKDSDGSTEDAEEEVTPESSEKEESDAEEESEEIEGERTEETAETEEEGQEGTGEEVNKTDKDPEIDYKQIYKEIFSPFKANGREITASSAEDVRKLMQMGANYNKKMQGLKPHLKLLKMLENNNLLEEEKLNYLIDLDKKNPGAINKLVKDSGIDPLSIDTEESTEYKPNTYTVNDKSVELDQILDEIKDTASFNTTLDIVGNKWDTTSKRIVSDNPAIIKIINNHVESGVYEQVQHVVDNERMFGRLEGMSDLEAYKHVVDVLETQGKLDTSKTEFKEPKLPVKPKSKTVDPKLKSRKKAASTTKAKSSAVKPKQDFNPLSMSDEEFEKLLGGQFV